MRRCLPQSREQRDVLLALQSVREVLELARNAAIALVGIGSVLERTFDVSQPAPGCRLESELRRIGAAGELVAHLLGRDGQPCDYALNERLVALSLDELGAIPLTIGISTGQRRRCRSPAFCAAAISTCWPPTRRPARAFSN